MQHMATVEVTGTLTGHLLPGTLFVLWALVWMGQAVIGRETSPSDVPLETGLVVPVLKVILALVGVWAEIPGQGWPPGRGWPPDAILTNWQHVTMYGVFGLTGVVDLLSARGALPYRVTHAAYAAAHANAGFLFLGHGSHGGVPGVVHSLLVLAFAGAALTALLEIARPSPGVSWARRGALLAVGSWFIAAGWILYLSGWDPADAVREGWSYMVFSWTMVVAGAVTIGAWMLARREASRGRRGE
jgi:hypothetical protein